MGNCFSFLYNNNKEPTPPPQQPEIEQIERVQQPAIEQIEQIDDTEYEFVDI